MRKTGISAAPDGTKGAAQSSRFKRLFLGAGRSYKWMGIESIHSQMTVPKCTFRTREERLGFPDSGRSSWPGSQWDLTLCRDQLRVLHVETRNPVFLGPQS
jgi:hypothetical protein